MSEVLFEFTSDNLETGLRGVPVGYCTTSKVDPKEGLFYVEQAISSLAEKEPEDVIYLLYSMQEGCTLSESEFKAELKKRAKLPQEIVDFVEKLPRMGHPMKMFTAATAIMGLVDNRNDYREDCLNAIARAPHLAAVVINHAGGFGPTPSPVDSMGYMENFSHMLNFPGKDHAQFTELMNLFNILHYDHGGGNLSAFVGKAVASGHQDMYGSLSAAMSALGGPLHGKANQDALSFVQKVHAKVGDNASVGDVENIIKEMLEKKELIYGFGHAVLRVEDPRAGIFYKFGEEHFPGNPLVKTALKLREAGPNVLGQNPKITNPFPNVDAISGTVLYAAGLKYPEFFTILFGMSRYVGISIQIVYERCIAREGKGTPIVRPKYIYKPPHSHDDRMEMSG